MLGLDFLSVPSAVPKGPSSSGDSMGAFALPLLAQIAGKVGAATVGPFIAKAQGHGARVARKDLQTQEASSLGLTYECIRVRDAAYAAGVAFTGDSGGKSQDKVGGAACDAYAAKLATGGKDFTTAATSSIANTAGGTGDADHPNPVSIASLNASETHVNPSAATLVSPTGVMTMSGTSITPASPVTKTANASVLSGSGFSSMSPWMIAAVVIVGLIAAFASGGHK